jgi:hypothetical protein
MAFASPYESGAPLRQKDNSPTIHKTPEPFSLVAQYEYVSPVRNKGRDSADFADSPVKRKRGRNPYDSSESP